MTTPSISIVTHDPYAICISQLYKRQPLLNSHSTSTPQTFQEQMSALEKKIDSLTARISQRFVEQFIDTDARINSLALLVRENQIKLTNYSSHHANLQYNSYCTFHANVTRAIQDHGIVIWQIQDHTFQLKENYKKIHEINFLQEILLKKAREDINTLKLQLKEAREDINTLKLQNCKN